MMNIVSSKETCNKRCNALISHLGKFCTELTCDNIIVQPNGISGITLIFRCNNSDLTSLSPIFFKLLVGNVGVLATTSTWMISFFVVVVVVVVVLIMFISDHSSLHFVQILKFVHPITNITFARAVRLNSSSYDLQILQIIYVTTPSLTVFSQGNFSLNLLNV